MEARPGHPQPCTGRWHWHSEQAGPTHRPWVCPRSCADLCPPVAGLDKAQINAGSTALLGAEKVQQSTELSWGGEGCQSHPGGNGCIGRTPMDVHKQGEYQGLIPSWASELEMNPHVLHAALWEKLVSQHLRAPVS